MNNSSVSPKRHIPMTARLLPYCLLVGALLVETGCVSQRAYEQAKSEADEANRALEAARAEVNELGQRIGELENDNNAKRAAVGEFRETLQHEVELLPVLKRQANEKFKLAQAQVASLVSQSRRLAKTIADAKKENASLKVLVAQYKEEIEDARLLAETPATAPIAEPPVAPPQPPVAEAPIPPPVAAPAPVTPPQQMAQVTPVTPAKPPAPPHPAAPPAAPEEESWFDMIMNWLTSAWDWVTGLFS